MVHGVVIAAAASATALAGVALIQIDEKRGGAHISAAEVASLRPDLALEPNAADDTPQATELAQRAPGEEAQPLPSFGAPVFADRRFVIKRILPISTALRYGEWHWDDTGVPQGPIIITVDLQARVLSIFRDGYEIGTAAVLLGTQEKPTPTGVFPISQKDKDHVSSLYDAKMPYMMRLTEDGVSIHATNVENGFASHGCVGVPTEFAAKLFGAAHLGDKVIITRGKQASVGDALEN